MILFPPLRGSSLSAEQVKALDDDFFRSRPAAYFRARIDELLDEDVQPVLYTSALGQKVAGLVDDSELLSSSRPSDRERTVQHAVDCFALRHHIAEVLVRFIAALWRTEGAHQEGAVSSVWWALASGRAAMESDIALIRSVDVETDGIRVAAMLGYPGPKVSPSTEDELQALLSTAWRWILHATDLFDGDGPDQNGAHNKVKHGFATLPADDLRLGFLLQGPQTDGTLKLSTVRDQVPIIDGIALVFLSRHPKPLAEFGTIEVTALTLDPAYLLAEATLLWRVYAALFATAAARHLKGEDDVDGLEPHRGLFARPTPAQFARHQPPSLRETLARSESGNPAPRSTTVFFEGYSTELRFTGPPVRGVVVSDAADIESE